MQSLDRISWPAVPKASLVLVPVGSVEQHGPHLPLGTDTAVAAAIAERAAPKLCEKPGGAEVLVAPPVTYGASGEHQDFPGTASIGNEALRLLLVELVRSLSTWAARVVLVNGHGGNVAALVSAVSHLVDEGHDVAWVSCTSGTVDAHAGHTETSLMLRLEPTLVDLSRARPGNVEPIEKLLPVVVSKGVLAASPSGVLGDPTTAHAKEGDRVLDAMVHDVIGRVRYGRRDPHGCLLRVADVPTPDPEGLSGG